MRFSFFFKRDKDKQAHLILLEAQNETMQIHNNLVAQQVDIFRNMTFTGENNKAIEDLKKIEERKLKLSVKPLLWLNGAGYNGLKGELKINNKGEYAKLIAFDTTSEDLVLHSKHLPSYLDKGERRYIFARTANGKHIKDCKYEIDVIYEDKLQNKYTAKIKGVGAKVKIVSDTLNH